MEGEIGHGTHCRSCFENVQYEQELSGEES